MLVDKASGPPSAVSYGHIVESPDRHRRQLHGPRLTLFQLGDPTNTKQVALGASNAVTPVALSVRGKTPRSHSATPPASALSISTRSPSPASSCSQLATPRDRRSSMTRRSSQTTPTAATSDASPPARHGYDQRNGTVAPSPTDIEVSGIARLRDIGQPQLQFLPNGNGIVTAIDAKTLAVLGTVSTGGTNSTAGAIGPDGNLYVVNTGDFVNPGSMTIINPSTLTIIRTSPMSASDPAPSRSTARAGLHLRLLRRYGHLEHQHPEFRPGPQ